MSISEGVLVAKLGLREKFPRKILHTRKSMLEVGLMKPSTIAAMLVIKLHLRHKRNSNQIAIITRINK